MNILLSDYLVRFRKSVCISSLGLVGFGLIVASQGLCERRVQVSIKGEGGQRFVFVEEEALRIGVGGAALAVAGLLGVVTSAFYGHVDALYLRIGYRLGVVFWILANMFICLPWRCNERGFALGYYSIILVNLAAIAAAARVGWPYINIVAVIGSVILACWSGGDHAFPAVISGLVSLGFVGFMVVGALARTIRD